MQTIGLTSFTLLCAVAGFSNGSPLQRRQDVTSSTSVNSTGSKCQKTKVAILYALDLFRLTRSLLIDPSEVLEQPALQLL